MTQVKSLCLQLCASLRVKTEAPVWDLTLVPVLMDLWDLDVKPVSLQLLRFSVLNKYKCTFVLAPC